MKKILLFLGLSIPAQTVIAWPELVAVDNRKGIGFLRISVDRSTRYYLVKPGVMLPPGQVDLNFEYAYNVSTLNAQKVVSAIPSFIENIPGAWAIPFQYIKIEVYDAQASKDAILNDKVKPRKIYYLQLGQIDNDAPMLPIIKVDPEKPVGVTWGEQPFAVGIKVDGEGQVYFDEATTRREPWKK